MNRLTTDKPDGNFETMLNFVYGKDGWAHIRHDGKNADAMLTSWAKAQCVERGCDELLAETPEEIDQLLCERMMDCPECSVALAYCFASQAVHMRGRLKLYEDILFAKDGTELISLDDLREMIKAQDNPPLTLKELREMDGESVWIQSDMFPADCGYRVIRRVGAFGVEFTDDRHFPVARYGKTWMAYRRKPEEGKK